MNSSQKERRCKANQRKGRCFKRLLLFRIVIQQKQLCFCFLHFQTREGHVEGFRCSHLLCTLCAERGDRGAADGNECRASLRIWESGEGAADHAGDLHTFRDCLCICICKYTEIKMPSELCFPPDKGITKTKP